MNIVDCHTHILSSGTKDYNRRFLQDLGGAHMRALGQLPNTRPLTEEDWAPFAAMFEPIDPEVSIADHAKAGVSRILILAQAPSDYTPYGHRGTMDLNGVTGVPGEPHIEKANDYVAALVKKYPESFIGFGSVNPRYRGGKAAIDELDRLITQLKLTGLKLYPMYDFYSPGDPELIFPIYKKAVELDIPVTVHMGGTTARFTEYEFGKPYLLDKVGQEFPDLRLLIAHGAVPWTDECINLVVRHPNFFIDLSYLSVILSREELFRYLDRCKRWGVPLTKVCWGTDYPLHETVETVLQKFLTVNEEAEGLSAPRISDEEMELMLGGNFLRICGLDQ